MTADSGAASSGPYANKDAGPSPIPLRSSGRPSFRMCICPLCYTAGAWPAQDNGGLPPPGLRLEQKRSGAALPEGPSLHPFRGLFVTKRIFLNFCLHSFPLSSRSLRVRRGGGIGRHAVLRWQWLRRASSTLALDTTKARGPFPSGKRPFSFAWGKSDLTARRGTILRRLTPSFFKKTTEKPARTILSGLFLLHRRFGQTVCRLCTFSYRRFSRQLKSCYAFSSKKHRTGRMP